jgi:hypothetical protein
MTTKFTALATIAETARLRMEALGIFKATHKAAISNSGQIWVNKDILAILPAAVVCMGNGAFESHGLVRNPSMLVIVVDEFKKDTETKAEGIWPLLDAVFESFTPQVEDGNVPVIEGVEFELKDYSPIESDARVVAFAVLLEGAESAITETEE